MSAGSQVRLAVLTAMVAAVLLAVAVLSRGETRAQGRVLWNGDVRTGDLRHYRVQQCKAGRTAVVPDPAGGARKVIRFAVPDSDVAPCTPTSNPRAQALSPPILKANNDYWIGWSVYVPKNFPVTRGPGDKWISLGSVYGPPSDANGSNGMKMDTSAGASRFYYRRGREYGFDQPWSSPLIRGRWVDFVFHIRLSKDPRIGFREQWQNTGSGWKRQELNGKPRLYMQTLTAANDRGPNVSKISLYRRRGITPDATLYFADHRVGTSFKAVQPTSYSPR